MTKISRLDAIRGHLYAHGLTGINELAAAIGASLATIRRDLQVLEEAGVIDRVHGGAQIASGSSVELDFEMRERQNLAAKRAIATAAMGLLQPHSSVFFDAGTTVLQVAARLRIEPQPLNVFTNGLKVAMTLLNVPKIKLFTLGGAVRGENASIIGSWAEAQLQSLWFDALLLGAGSITENGDIFSVDGGEASGNQRMLERATAKIILADSSKFGAPSTFKVATISAGMTVVTDDGLSLDWRRRIADWGARLVVAGPVAGGDA